MTLAASIFPLLCWFLYAIVANRIEVVRPSLSIIMSLQRKRWVEKALRRESPLDAILSSNLMNAIAFFASTTVLIILALFAVIGQASSVMEALQVVQPDREIAKTQVEFHLAVLLVLFVAAFLSFTLSLRQFNHFCIVLGAAAGSEKRDPDEIFVLAALNTLGARNFNQGIRAYYFALGMLAWFISPIGAIAVTVIIFAFILYREFYSSARELVARLKPD